MEYKVCFSEFRSNSSLIHPKWIAKDIAFVRPKCSVCVFLCGRASKRQIKEKKKRKYNISHLHISVHLSH